MKLEFKYIISYLPYELLIKCDYYNHYGRQIVTDTVLTIANYNKIIKGKSKPYLHPLSDLTKKIEVNGEKFVPNHLPWFCEVDSDNKVWMFKHSLDDNLKIINKLFEWHFDVFGLIKNNLAVDINNLKL